MKRILLLPLALALSACSSKTKPQVAAEAAKREAYAKAISLDAGSINSWNVSSTNEILYQEGFSILSHDPPEDFRNPAFRWMGQNAHVRLRSHGNRPMLLHLIGWVHKKVTMTRPTVAAYIDGQLVLATDAVAPTGHFNKKEWIPAELLKDQEWVDLRITVSAVAFHWADPPDLRVVVLNELHWRETDE